MATVLSEKMHAYEAAKAAGADATRARQRAFDQIDTILKNQLRATVIGFADA